MAVLVGSRSSTPAHDLASGAFVRPVARRGRGPERDPPPAPSRRSHVPRRSRRDPQGAAAARSPRCVDHASELRPCPSARGRRSRRRPRRPLLAGHRRRLMPAFPVVDVDEWEVVDYEPMGSKPGKLWLQPPAGSPFAERRWLFKPTTIQRERDREFLKGDDWAEKLVAEVAHLLGVSA